MILVLVSLHRTKSNNNYPILDDSSHPLLDGVNYHPILDDSSHPLLYDVNCRPIFFTYMNCESYFTNDY